MGAAGAAIRGGGHGNLAGPGRDRPIQRVGDARGPDLAAGRGSAQLREVLATGGFSVQSVAHRIGVERECPNRPFAGGALRSDIRPGVGRQGAGCSCRGRSRHRGHRRPGEPGHRPGPARVRINDPGYAAHQLFHYRRSFGPGPECVVAQAQSAAHR